MGILGVIFGGGIGGWGTYYFTDEYLKYRDIDYAVVSDCVLMLKYRGVSRPIFCKPERPKQDEEDAKTQLNMFRPA